MLTGRFWTLLGFLVYSTASAGEGNGLLARRWFEARTAHFNAYSCGSTQEVARLIARLEQFRESYSLLAGTQAVASPPIVVMAYPDQESMAPFLPLYQGKPASLTAFFKPDSDESLIVLPVGISVSLEAVYHEFAHLLFRHNGPYWPLWLKEGMSEIYSTFEVTAANRVRIGKPIGRHLRLLKAQELVPLKQLFAINHHSQEYNEEEHQGIFYAQSWLLTHYLMLGPSQARKAQFGQLTPLLKQGQMPEQAFTNAFRTTLAAMETELRSYLEKEKFASHDFSVKADLLAPRALATRHLTKAETCFRLGNQLLRVGRFDTADEYFSRIHTLDAKSPLGFEGLGLSAAERGKSEEATRLLKEALQRGSTSFLAHYVYAREKYRLTSRTPDTYTPVKGPVAAEIREGLEKSLELMPSFGPAHHMLGFFQMVQGEDLSSAEKHLQAAIRLEPEEQAYILSMAQVRLLKDGTEAARKALEPLRRSYVPAKLRAQAEEMLKELDEPRPGRRPN